MMRLIRRKKQAEVEPESVAVAITRLEFLADRIQAAAAVLEQLVATYREEEDEEVMR